MAVTKIKLERFTAFKDLEVEFSPGINALVGANGTGKTHLMKACYAACDTSKTPENFAAKLVSVFLPFGRSRDRLVHQASRDALLEGKVEVFTDASSFGVLASPLTEE